MLDGKAFAGDLSYDAVVESADLEAECRAKSAWGKRLNRGMKTERETIAPSRKVAPV